jgi:hypothetical protein
MRDIYLYELNQIEYNKIYLYIGKKALCGQHEQ